MTGDVTKKGVELIDRWKATQKEVEAAKRALSRAECDFRNAENELAKWLLPRDAKPGEVFCIWHGRQLIQVENEYRVDDRRVPTKISIRMRDD